MEIRCEPGESDLDWNGDIAAETSATATVDVDAAIRVVHTADSGSMTVATCSGNRTIKHI